MKEHIFENSCLWLLIIIKSAWWEISPKITIYRNKLNSHSLFAFSTNWWPDMLNDDADHNRYYVYHYLSVFNVASVFTFIQYRIVARLGSANIELWYRFQSLGKYVASGLLFCVLLFSLYCYIVRMKERNSI